MEVKLRVEMEVKLRVEMEVKLRVEMALVLEHLLTNSCSCPKTVHNIGKANI
jgi:hypothetical protein